MRRESGAGTRNVINGSAGPIMDDYSEFLSKKIYNHIPSGFDTDTNKMNSALFDWQAVLVRWALRKGKAALFEDCGLGKTIQQLEWARLVCGKTGGSVLIFAPLSVSHQTVREGEKFGYSVNRCEKENDVVGGINITNYERIDLFDLSKFSGVVLDESSIIKSFTGQFRNKIISSSISIPYRLACSATPSPNDYTELGNTAEFLGVLTRSEMLSMFFINDTSETSANWRLKGHVRKNKFWEWLSSWCVMIQKPSDIGFSDDGFILPEIKHIEHVIPYTGKRTGLFVEPAIGLSGIRASMRESISVRCEMCAAIVNDSPLQHVVWCSLNDESRVLSSIIPDAVEVKGQDDPEHKEKSFFRFANGDIRVLVTKPKIAMYGMNWQNCCNTVITGLSHSYEQYYQLVRRFWRFGQPNPVNVHIVIGEREGRVLDTIRTKDEKIKTMFSSMILHMRDLMKNEIESTSRKVDVYNPQKEMVIPEFIKGAA